VSPGRDLAGIVWALIGRAITRPAPATVRVVFAHDGASRAAMHRSDERRM
jgi:hypothetical protein